MTSTLPSALPKWYATWVILRLEEEKEPEGLKPLHVGGSDGISCQHLQELMTQMLQKLSEWQKDRRKDEWHGSEKRPTMYVATMDIKTALDVARPNQISEILGEQGTSGWITAALVRDMEKLDGQAALKHVESVEAPAPWLTLAKHM